MLVQAQVARRAPSSVTGHELRQTAAALQPAGTTLPFTRNSEIYAQEDPAEYCYKVVSGAVRTCRLLADGRRQVEGFYVAGEFFGYGADETYRSSAEAIVATTVIRYQRCGLEAFAATHGPTAYELWTAAVRDLSRAQEHAAVLGRGTACERVSAFLLEVATRTGSREAIELPMTRSDIGDYLGLASETVSRVFTQLVEEGVISLPRPNQVLVHDRSALQMSQG